ncbi:MULTISPECIES: MerR family transcriptional regulator [unclassified Paracoccus (in: a-proteobacteria)]|uniref:MerR family transcriptional regulator n=1 Tax=unclassified Paracoccus (in: a-proteobacteria) TaxID=2688777 RepID=UPI0012B438AC|nr:MULTISPECIES: MerR family transcriptional regulator [unclassified Paracoccus (in: a-proteobacteria)]UXU76357.1 MerR family transcriptional regulator [Paracoccus sp. SMMA_5]UXU82305.1 MerR family transcriptional regulator [Paracoccus sp. SMMA_5_TC]
MSKSPDAFRSIGEVSRLVGVAPHVLRYWETQFAQLAPVKRADGRRYYRPDDVRLVAGLCQVMREEGLSIRGAKRLIAGDRGAGLRRIGAVRLGESSEAAADTITLVDRSPRPENADAPRPSDPASADRPARASRRRMRPAPDSLPLFDECPPSAAAAAPAPAWLDRLTLTALALDAFEMRGVPLPEGVAELRTRLRAML